MNLTSIVSRHCLVAAICAALAVLAVAQSAADYDSDVERDILNAVNRERKERGLPELALNPLLIESARQHAFRMAEVEMLSHQFKDEPPPALRMAATGLHFSSSAENVAMATDAGDIHPGLMQSEGHRANILSPKYNAIGVGVVKRGAHYFASQNFARTIDIYSPQQAEEALGAALNRIRREAGLPLLHISGTAPMRESACGMGRGDKVDAHAIPVAENASGALAFNVNDLSEPPDALKKLAHRTDVQKLFLAACFMSSKSFPGGTFWFAAAF